MGRRNDIAISATIALSILTSGFSFAQGPPSSGKRGGRPGPHHNEFRGGGAAHDRLLQLSPEERQAFRKNAERWLKMGPEERNMLRQREKMRREQLKIEAEAAMRQLNLRLDQNARDQFESRYFQERRKIERVLRDEIETKRQQQLPELNERLKNEFQSHQASPAFSASPGGSAKPAASTKPGD